MMTLSIYFNPPHPSVMLLSWECLFIQLLSTNINLPPPNATLIQNVSPCAAIDYTRHATPYIVQSMQPRTLACAPTRHKVIHTVTHCVLSTFNSVGGPVNGVHTYHLLKHHHISSVQFVRTVFQTLHYACTCLEKKKEMVKG